MNSRKAAQMTQMCRDHGVAILDVTVTPTLNICSASTLTPGRLCRQRPVSSRAMLLAPGG